jgi:hypothetical protein
MRRLTLPIGCIALAALACSCRKDITADSIEKSPDAITEQGPSGSASWIVQPDGTVRAALKGPDGKPVAQPVTGQITFGNPDGPPTSVPVHYDPQTGVLSAAGPKLDADITPVTYALKMGDTPLSGTIGVPPGGTHDLAETGSLQTALPPGTVGPNGGTVQMVGPDRVELVANKHTGDVRAYVLDANNHPVDPGDRKITIEVAGPHPGVVVLAPEPHAHFVVGHVPALIDAPQVTVAMRAHGTTHACLVGWAPGSVVVVGPQAPHVHVLAVVDAWPDEVIEVHAPHGVIVGAPTVVIGGGVVVEHRGWGWGHHHHHGHDEDD